MPGRNPDSAKLWQDAYVYAALGSAPRPTLPTDIDTAMPATYVDLGLLDGEKGFAEARGADQKKFYAWGFGLFKSSRKNYELSGKFTLYQEPEAEQFVWPGSTATELKIPKQVTAWLAFETVDDGAKKERRFTRQKATLFVPQNDRNESDPSQWELEYELYPDATGVVFDRQRAA